jgi:hypothetical protein
LPGRQAVRLTGPAGTVCAGELEDLQPDGSAIIVSYRLQDDIAEAILRFGADGMIGRCLCGARRCCAVAAEPNARSARPPRAGSR